MQIFHKSNPLRWFGVLGLIAAILGVLLIILIVMEIFRGELALLGNVWVAITVSASFFVIGISFSAFSFLSDKRYARRDGLGPVNE